MNNYILTDGQKSLSLLHSNDPAVWTFFSGAPTGDDVTLYSKVAAAFRAYNLKANTVASMPFIIWRGETEFDNSATWENKVGFLPNPNELLRLDTLSYIATNTIYNVRTTDALGYKQKGLYHAIPTAFNPVTDPVTGALLRIERMVGTRIEQYQPEDKRLFRAWRLDHTTEVLPSKNTEAQAIANAAGIMYHADSWVKHFFERGGVPPTVIGMKGAITPTKTEEEEKNWGNFLRGLGKRFSRMVRVFNAETLDVKQFGSSVTELKDNAVYEQALANIAMGTGMPLSLLMANSANYATAKEEKATWFESDIIPFCQWLAYEYNAQIFEPLGLRLEFQPQTLDPQQEDETQKAQAMSIYADSYAKFPNYDLWRGTMDMMGIEVPDALDTAAKKFYTDKEEQAKLVQEQMQGAGYVVGADGKPLPAQQQPEAQAEQEDTPADDKEDETEDEEEDTSPAKFVPTLDQARELQKWQELTFRKFKRGDPLPTDWRNDTLPGIVYRTIVGALQTATDEAGIKAAFDVAMYAEPEPVTSDIKVLADALNNLASKVMDAKA